MHGTHSKWLLAAVLCNICALPAIAQKLNAKHPGYLQALADIRSARYYLNKQEGSPKLKSEEAATIKELDAATAEIKAASIDDGKGVNDVPATVDDKEHGSPLGRALEDIYHARGDIEKEEDAAEVRTLRKSAIDHLSKAGDTAKEAHLQWLAELKETQKK